MDTQAFFSYMHTALTPYHAARNSNDILVSHGFQPLSADAGWSLSPGGRYFISPGDGSNFAFVLPESTPRGFHLVCAHNDSPALRLKPQPELVREGMTMLNIEVYGGPILSTWLDRPLAIAGRLYFRNDADWLHPLSPLVALPETVTVPSLAAHMKRGDDPINPQKELLALWGSTDAPALSARLCAAAGPDLSEEDLLAHELYLVSAETPSILGAEGDLYAASRIDNLANAYAGTCALCDCSPRDHIAVFASFQHEEIGSHTRQGAASQTLSRFLSRIARTLGMDPDALRAESLILSCDQAHAAHPNHPEKADPVLRPRLGAGPVLKLAASHSYATTPRGEAVFRALCEREGISYQYFTNRADMRGGSTIGPIAEVASGIEAIDIGSPMLAMHSIRELASLRDQAAMQQLMTAFLSV